MNSMESKRNFTLLDEQDNILVCCLASSNNAIVTGFDLTLKQAVNVGHKIARFPIKSGDKIVRYGAPIGSAIQDIVPGEHVHLHNMKSDYISSHTREGKQHA